MTVRCTRETYGGTNFMYHQFMNIARLGAVQKLESDLENNAVQTCVTRVDLVKSFQTSMYYLVFTYKNRLRYRRDRASQSLAKISQIIKVRKEVRIC